ncbi:MAG TPA: LemA family protein, partial [Burkholderiales bacterium]|nr:LemA family protein [Burkholderiales bacterium]
MSLYTIALLALTAILVVYAIMIYNSLVTVKHNVSKAWANLEVLLKQRHDEIPKLIEVCKQYRQFEQDTLSRVIEA